jgi:hypothetical protein
MTRYDDYWADGSPAEVDPLNPSKARLLSAALAELAGAVTVVELGGGSLSHWNHVDAGVRGRVSLVNVEVSQVATDRVPGELAGTFGELEHVRSLDDVDTTPQLLAAFEVLEHINPVRGTLDQLRQLAPADTPFIGSVPYHGFVKNVLLAAAWDRHFPVDNVHVQFFTPRSLGDVLAATGFDVKARQRWGRFGVIAKSIAWVAHAA